jgi:hypothetical protein
VFWLAFQEKALSSAFRLTDHRALKLDYNSKFRHSEENDPNIG